jgi:hypothetical protein
MAFLLLGSFFVFGEVHFPHWDHIYEVRDRHEFYVNQETISKPKDTWQTLLSLVYFDKEVQKVKDCIFFKVPGTDPGILKIKSLPFDQKCDTYLLTQGDKEVSGIKALEFSLTDEDFKINFSTVDFKVFNWTAFLLKKPSRNSPQMHLSSAEFKDSKIFFLASKKHQISSTKNNFKKDHELCHNVDDDCKEVSPSDCSSCKSGWYEVPNGCQEGPKYCGLQNCGGENRPACRRGMRWQRGEGTFDCKTDSSFAYCSKGLAIECEGRKAFCR